MTSGNTLHERLSLLKQGLVNLARKLGYNGSPFFDGMYPVGTYEQEQAIIDLVLSTKPRPQTDRQKKIVDRWARNLVMSSTFSNTPVANCKRERKW